MRARTWAGLLTFFAVLLAWSLIQSGLQARASYRNDPILIPSIRGENLYKAYCASCHGENGRGNGPMASWMKVAPSDLTLIARRNGGKFPIERVDRIISGEEPLPSGHGTRAMPVWGPVFSQVTRDQDLGKVRIDNLARYLRDMQR